MPFTVGNIFGTTTTGVRGGTISLTNTQRAVACSCPACTGLECLDRPRFFAGQLLSEAELNSEMDYILAKQRLHNRYLHGVGTVCGLEVVCSNCDGQVVIKPGYAIDPCGNDIIVCQEQQFDVLKAIKACCDAIKKKNKGGCDPYRPFNEGCTGLEEKWCITIAYQELQTQPVTPLHGQTKTCSCVGSCSPVGSCGCSSCNGSTTTKSNGCTPTLKAPATPASIACEPTRVLESFTLGVVPDPGDCSEQETLFQNTLFAKLMQCISLIKNFFNNFSPTTARILGLASTGQLVGSGTLNSDAFVACCQFHQFLVDLFTKADFAIKCSALSTFDAIQCPQPPQSHDNPSDDIYLGVVQKTIDQMGAMLLEYIRDCVCHTLLPPCPTDPGDDRLILACLTIQGGKITDICNFGCRQFAGGFPSFLYWLSIIPIVAGAKQVINKACCSPALLTKNSPLVNNLQAMDPGGVLQRAVTEGNFALLRMLMDRSVDVIQKFSLEGIIGSIPASGLNLATLRGMSAENARAALNQFNVSYEEKQVNSRADIPIVPETPTALGDLFIPFAQSGDHVVLFETGGSVVEVQRAGIAPPGAAEIADLRTQVAALRAEIATLKTAQAKKK